MVRNELRQLAGLAEQAFNDYNRMRGAEGHRPEPTAGLDGRNARRPRAKTEITIYNAKLHQQKCFSTDGRRPSFHQDKADGFFGD